MPGCTTSMPYMSFDGFVCVCVCVCLRVLHVDVCARPCRLATTGERLAFTCTSMSVPVCVHVCASACVCILYAYLLILCVGTHMQ
jgi:hypothetical protein